MSSNNFIKISFVVISALAMVAVVKADLCTMGAKKVNGDWYCQAVKAIVYSNVGTPGHYDQIFEMGTDGVCQSQPKAFSGSIAPLDEEISLHFRGPVYLKQLAAYSPVPSTSKKKRKLAHDHGILLHELPKTSLHHHHHEHENLIEERQVVTATIDGKVVTWNNNYFGPSSVTPVIVAATIDGMVESWTNDWFGPATTLTTVKSSTSTAILIPTSSANAAVGVMVTATIDGQVQTWTNNWFGSSSISISGYPIVAPTNTPIAVNNSPVSANPSPPAPTAQSSPLTKPPSGLGINKDTAYERIGYYDSASQIVDNLVFLGNFGGQGSGVFDIHYGASVSYVNSTGTGGSASPQILADKTIPSNNEVIVMLGEKCDIDSCGFVRPGAVAHRGFDGADKIFLMEFSMPNDGSAPTAAFNADMPAIWMLNAQIPRTVQYGPPTCSCWTTGCGEFDIAETLYAGSNYMKSTMHTNTPAGDSDYFVRPTVGTMKLAVIFSSATSSIHLQVLPDDADFSKGLSAADVNGMCTTTSEMTSHFAVAT